MCRPPNKPPQAASLDARLGFATHERYQRASTVGRALVALWSLAGDEAVLFPLPLLLGCIVLLTQGGTATRFAVLAELFGDLGMLSFVEQVLKLARGRRRPHYAKQSTFYVLQGEHFSWPSGHTMRAFFAATNLVFSRPWHAALGFRPGLPLALFAASAALATAFARVAKGKHYPSDVVAGAVVGTGLASLSLALGPGAWATLKYPCGVAMCLEATAVLAVPAWRTRGFYIHVLIAALWCVSTRIGLGPWSHVHALVVV